MKGVLKFWNRFRCLFSNEISFSNWKFTMAALGHHTAAATTIIADANKIQKGKNENSVINGKKLSMERDVYHTLFWTSCCYLTLISNNSNSLIAVFITLGSHIL